MTARQERTQHGGHAPGLKAGRRELPDVVTHVVGHYDDPVALCCDRDVQQLLAAGDRVVWQERGTCPDAVDLVEQDDAT